jgi:hypothetical protein
MVTDYIQRINSVLKEKRKEEEERDEEKEERKMKEFERNDEEERGKEKEKEKENYKSIVKKAKLLFVQELSSPLLVYTFYT